MSRQTRLVSRLVFARSKIRDLAAARFGNVSQQLADVEKEISSRKERFLSQSRQQLREAPNSRALWLVEFNGRAQRGWAAVRQTQLEALEGERDVRRRELVHASSQLRAAERVRDRLRSEHTRIEARREQSALDDRSALDRARKGGDLK